MIIEEEFESFEVFPPMSEEMKSKITGSVKRIMTLEQAIERYQLTTEEVEKLKEIIKNKNQHDNL